MVDDVALLRELRCGEGMAGQNSNTMIVGIGNSLTVQSIEVLWPSGATQQIPSVQAGSLLTIFEDADMSPQGTGFVSEPYAVPPVKTWNRHGGQEYTSTLTDFSESENSSSASEDDSEPQIRLYTTMATWCASCKSHLPEIKQLRTTLNKKTLGLFGVPVDSKDDSDRLGEYVKRYQPAYTLLKETTDDQRRQIEEVIEGALETDVLPASVVTDSAGNVLLVTAGLPTVSQIMQIIN